MRLVIKNRTFAGETAIGGKLNLLLSGFSGQDMVPIDDIVHSIDRLPRLSPGRFARVAYLPLDAVMPAYPAYPRCEPRGEYVQVERRIFVYGFDSPTMFFHMLHHEIGHFVFFLGDRQPGQETLGHGDLPGLVLA